MNAILWKEYLEHRLHFLIIVGMGLLSTFALAWFKQLDQDTLTTLLFLFEAPLFTMMLATHIIAHEVENGTFPFLIGLPRSRTGIWGAKLLFLVLFTAAIYAAYLVIALGAGFTPTPFRLFPSEFNMRMVSQGFLLLGLPAAVLACGYATSMLPTGFPVVVIMGFTCAGALCLWTKAYLFLNFALLTVLLTLSGLAISWLVFHRCGMMDGWNRLGWAAVGGTIAFCGSLGVWTGLDHLAERFPGEREWVPWQHGVSPDGRALAVKQFTPSTAWDPIQDHNSPRTMVIDTHTGQQRQIGPRGTLGFSFSGDSRKLAAETLYHWPGLFTDASRLVEIDLETGAETLVDADASPDEYGPDGTLFYRRLLHMPNGGKVTEFCRRLPDGERKVFHSVLNPEPRAIGLPRFGAILFVPDADPPYLVDIVTGHTRPMGIPLHDLGAWLRDEGTLDFPGFAMVQTRHGNPSHARTWVVSPSGAASEAAWIPVDTRPVGTLDDHRAIVLIPDADPVQDDLARSLSENASAPVSFTPSRFRPQICDFTARTLTDLPEWTEPVWHSLAALSSNKRLFCSVISVNGDSQIKCLDLTTGKPLPLVRLAGDRPNQILPLGPEAFLLQGYSTFQRFDPIPGQLRRVFDL